MGELVLIFLIAAAPYYQLWKFWRQIKLMEKILKATTEGSGR